MSGIYGFGSSNQLREEYAAQLEQFVSADWMQLPVEEPLPYVRPYPPEYLPQDHAAPETGWDGDPGIYAEPDPAWGGDPGIVAAPDPEFAGDPGIYAEPPTPTGPPVRDEAPRGRVLAPSIVPGLDWITGGPYRDLGPASPPAAPDGATTPGESAAKDGVARLTLGDHIREGAQGFLLPSLFGGVVSGALAASALRGTGLGGAAFAGRVFGNVALGVATGAGAGLLVAATSPTDSDSLAARYAVAGAALGAAGGAAFPGGGSRALSAVLGAVSGAIVAGFTGHHIQKSV